MPAETWKIKRERDVKKLTDRSNDYSGFLARKFSLNPNDAAFLSDMMLGEVLRTYSEGILFALENKGLPFK